MCVGYASDTDCLITYESGCILKKPSASYEELIRMADEILQDYKPSDYIMSKYHIG